MSYQAYVVELKDVRKHPNADRLQLASCLGDQVVVGLDAHEGQLGVYFPTDGQLSHEFCLLNNLYSKSARQKLGLADSPVYGFFDHNRRVRAQTFRGEKSEGFFLPVKYLDRIPDISLWVQQIVTGYAFTSLGDFVVCQKYITPKTKHRSDLARSGGRKGELAGFPKHYDTKQFRYEVDSIPVGSVVYVTEKLHGTSHRVGLVRTPVEQTWWRKLLGLAQKYEWTIQHGTRNVILGDGTGVGYYGSDEFRLRALEGVELKLRKGEVLYGELVGFHDFGQPIMPRVNVPAELDDTKKNYGEQITYTYGCHEAECKFYLYRVVQFNEDGDGTELSWPQVLRRAEQLGVEVVPQLTGDAWGYLGDLETYGPLVMHGNEETHETLSQVVEALVEGPSKLDPTHLREGVCVRVETPDGHIYNLKHKSFAFKVLEGIIKLDDQTEDMEESA